jgi:uncharacterized protein YciI
LIAALGFAGCAAADPDPSDPDARAAAPDAWEVCHVVRIAAAADAPALDEAELGAVMDAHIAYQLKMQADGDALVAGGFGPGEDPAARGMTVLTSDTLEAAQALAAADPAVRAGVFSVDVRAWYIPAQGWCPAAQ